MMSTPAVKAYGARDPLGQFSSQKGLISYPSRHKSSVQVNTAVNTLEDDSTPNREGLKLYCKLLKNILIRS